MRKPEQPTWSGNFHNAHLIEYIDFLLDKSDDELTETEREILSPFIHF